MSVRGELKSMPVTDFIQWIEMNKKTGVLSLRRHGEDVEKCFCFKEGRIIFVSSRRAGERLGEFLSRNGHIDEEKMTDALFQSRNEGVSFTHYLVEKRIVPKEFLIVAVTQLAEIVLSDILTWEEGWFEFQEGLPEIVMNGPVFLNTSFLILESVRKHDEMMKRKREEGGA